MSDLQPEDSSSELTNAEYITHRYTLRLLCTLFVFDQGIRIPFGAYQIIQRLQGDYSILVARNDINVSSLTYFVVIHSLILVGGVILHRVAQGCPGRKVLSYACMFVFAMMLLDLLNFGTVNREILSQLLLWARFFAGMVALFALYVWANVDSELDAKYMRTDDDAEDDAT